jgi:S1-C subfamily serine protease
LKYEVETLIRDGRVIRPVIGVSYLDTSQAKSFGINSGILVLNPQQGSAAAKAGVKGTTRTASGAIELGDIIIGIDNDKIDSEKDLFQAIEKHQVGDRVTLKLLRSMKKTAVSEEDANVGFTLKPIEIQITLSAPAPAPSNIQTSSYALPTQQ